jgi:hypothetical protein
MFKIEGKVKQVNETEVISDKFQKREFVVTDSSGMYPQDIIMQLQQENVMLADSLFPGSEVIAHFNLRGREWTSPKGEVKHFNTLDCWKIESK